MAVGPEQQAEQIRQAKEEARRQVEQFRQAAQEPEQQREWVRQNNVIYGGLIAIDLVLVQPFLTETTLDRSAKVCVIAFSAAIPLLAALVLVNYQENFRRRMADSVAVRVTQSIAQLLAFVGVVAGFWHIMWLAGVGILVTGFVAMLVHSAGYLRLERACGPRVEIKHTLASHSQTHDRMLRAVLKLGVLTVLPARLADMSATRTTGRRAECRPQ